MNMKELADLMLEAIDNGADPDQPVFTHDADAGKMLEVRAFTYGQTCYFYCDEA